MVKETFTSYTYDARQNQTKIEVVEKVSGKQSRRTVTTGECSASDDSPPVKFLMNTGKNNYTKRTYDQNDVLVEELVFKLRDGKFRKRDEAGNWGPWKKYQVVY